MYIIGYFLSAIATVLNSVLWLYMWLMVIQAVLSWINPDPYNPIVRFIHKVTEPVLYQVRTRIPVVFGGIDLSPMIIILAIVFLRSFLVKSLARLAQSFI